MRGNYNERSRGNRGYRGRGRGRGGPYHHPQTTHYGPPQDTSLQQPYSQMNSPFPDPNMHQQIPISNQSPIDFQQTSTPQDASQIHCGGSGEPIPLSISMEAQEMPFELQEQAEFGLPTAFGYRGGYQGHGQYHGHNRGRGKERRGRGHGRPYQRRNHDHRHENGDDSGEINPLMYYKPSFLENPWKELEEYHKVKI